MKKINNLFNLYIFGLISIINMIIAVNKCYTQKPFCSSLTDRSHYGIWPRCNIPIWQIFCHVVERTGPCVTCSHTALWWTAFLSSPPSSRIVGLVKSNDLINWSYQMHLLNWLACILSLLHCSQTQAGTTTYWTDSSASRS